jgi:hypothetical protein
MLTRALAWLSPLPLVAAVGLAAHAVGYRVVAAAPAGHAHSLDATSHGASAWYVCAALCGATALVALTGIAVLSARRRTPFRAPLWLVALVPPLGFTAQEELGGLLHTGALTALPVEATFLFGLLLQIPVALLALLLVRALLATAAVLVRSLRSTEPRKHPRRIIRPRPAWLDLAPSFPALALGYGERGPPALLLS